MDHQKLRWALTPPILFLHPALVWLENACPTGNQLVPSIRGRSRHFAICICHSVFVGNGILRIKFL